MTRHIVVAITPDEDGVRCGKCDGLPGFAVRTPAHCVYARFAAVIDEYLRGPACLAAEAKLTALIEAGDGMRNAPYVSHQYTQDVDNAWDRAVAEVR